MLAVQGACPHGGSPGVGPVIREPHNEKSHSTFVEWLLSLSIQSWLKPALDQKA